VTGPASRPALAPGPYLVVGLARSGVAALTALRARGLTAQGVDSGTPDLGGLDGVHVGTDGVALLDGVQVVVKSPGVPQEAPVIAAARERGLAVMGELELAWRLLPNPFVAVTGTNGKTTTVELLGHVHREAGLPVVVAGNVGTALTGLAVSPETVVVAETSSFQLEDTLAFAPEAAALLNLTPDHLDRHGTFAAYQEAKEQAFSRQTPDQLAVLPDGFSVPGDARRVRFGGAETADVRLDGGTVTWRGEPLIAVEDIRLRGPHNVRNAMAAAALALGRDVDPDALRAALRTFAGVPHRLEEIATHDGVVYVNDSKATNVDSTIVALRAFRSGVHLILGGRGKGQDFGPLRPLVAERCASVHLIGEDAERIGLALGGEGAVDGDLERAVDHARRLARPGEVVLLSPACASFDQFKDFEARGDAFRALVRRIGT
jgi:UDP-N-acetylmuramoylalanine--D-glutamate ligase